MGFNKEEFANLLEKAKGDRSINKYASDADLSPAHISRLLRKLLDTPPSPETIAKLSQSASNGVSYDSFMLAAGHINEAEDNTEEDARDRSLEIKFQQSLTSHLLTLGKAKAMNFPNKEMKLFDLIVELQNDVYSRWYFTFKPSIRRASFINFLGQLALNNFKANEKISIAVTSGCDYEYLLEMKPKSLKLNLYVMLVDLNSLEIKKEEELCLY